MTVATTLAAAARPHPLLSLLRRYPLPSYVLIAYAFTSAFDLLVHTRFPDGRSFPRQLGPSLAILLHTAINWTQLVTSGLFPAAGTNEEGPLVALGVTALVLLVATRGRLGYAGPWGQAGVAARRPALPRGRRPERVVRRGSTSLP